MGFSCSACFLLLPVLLFLYAAADVDAPGALWATGILLPLPGLVCSIRASRRREHLGDGLDVLTSLGVGLGWVGIAILALLFVVVIISLSINGI